MLYLLKKLQHTALAFAAFYLTLGCAVGENERWDNWWAEILLHLNTPDNDEVHEPTAIGNNESDRFNTQAMNNEPTLDNQIIEAVQNANIVQIVVLRDQRGVHLEVFLHLAAELGYETDNPLFISLRPKYHQYRR